MVQEEQTKQEEGADDRVLSLGTKFIPKWKVEKINNAFKYVTNFIRRMNKKVYFTETKPGV